MSLSHKPAVRLKIYSTRYGGEWVCYHCHEQPDIVWHITGMDGEPASHHTFYCMKCLQEMLDSGEWTLYMGDPIVTVNEVIDEVLARNDVENDSGTSRIGDVEVVW